MTTITQPPGRYIYYSASISFAISESLRSLALSILSNATHASRQIMRPRPTPRIWARVATGFSKTSRAKRRTPRLRALPTELTQLTTCSPALPAGRVIRPGLMRYGIVSEKMIPAAKLHGNAKTSHAPVAASATNGRTPKRRQLRTPAANPTRTNNPEWSRFWPTELF